MPFIKCKANADLRYFLSAAMAKLFKKELLKAFDLSHEAFEKIRREMKGWHETHAYDDEFLHKNGNRPR